MKPKTEIFSWLHEIEMVPGFPPDEGPKLFIAYAYPFPTRCIVIGTPQLDRRKVKRLLNRYLKGHNVPHEIVPEFVF